MAFDTYEESVEGGQPVELFEFTVGASVSRYTSAEDDVTFSGNVYTSLAIAKTNPTLTATTDGRAQMEITIPHDNPIAQRYIGIVPSEPVYVTILKFHRGDPANGISLWKGRVANAKFTKQGGLCTLYSVSSESTLARMCPARKYQALCNHRLYDSLCQVVRTSFKHTGNVTAISASTITVDGLGAKGANWAVGGVVEFGTERRLVTAQSGNTVTLKLPFPEDPSGNSVDVYAGCDHSLATCDTKFSNSINFGGFPYVPTSNPFNTGL